MTTTSPRLQLDHDRDISQYIGVPATITTDAGETLEGVFDVGCMKENLGALIVLTMEGQWAFADHDRIDAFKQAEHIPCTAYDCTTGIKTRSVMLCEPTIVKVGPDLCPHGHDRGDYNRTVSVDFDGNTLCCDADETFPMDWPNAVCRCCRADVDDRVGPPAEPIRVEIDVNAGTPLDGQPSAIIAATADLTFGN